jgi:hypothetical protein
MASKKKPAICGLARPQGWDDVVKPIAKGAAKRVKKPVKKAAAKSKARYDIPDPAFKGKVYGSGGSMTKAYKDYVLRNMDADF